MSMEVGISFTPNWIVEETKTADLGDARLNKRLGNVLEMLNRKPTESIPAASRGWNETKAAYRFFDNPDVTGEKILQPHKEATIERMRKEPIILLPQDTTELDYSSKPETKGLGKLSFERQLGMLLHPTIAFTSDRVCLGVVDSQILIREELRRKDNLHLLPIIAYSLGNQDYQMLCLCIKLTKILRKPTQAELPIEQKESIRWINGYRVAQELAKQLSESKIISIADREGDIYEIFIEASKVKAEGHAEFIIRGNQDRKLATEENIKEHTKLKKKIGNAPVIGTVEFTLPPAKNRKARKVEQEIRSASVELRAPYRPDRKLPNVIINVVLAREINAPHGVEPIEWLLLTSLPVNTAERAIQIITWYLCRWQIEIFFRILKSGCAVEELQLQTMDRLKPCLALYMIIAWRILHMTMLGRSCSKILCTAVFEDEEWHAVYRVTYRCPPPIVPPNLNRIIKMVAGLGGFLNRKNDGFPGAQTIWLGLQRTRDFVIAMEALDASRK